MNRIEITKTGIKCHYYDEELRNHCIVIEIEGEWFVMEEGIDGKELHEASSRQDADNFFYKEKEIGDIYPHFRESCTIADGVTWGDLLRIIEENDSLKLFVEKCYPNYRLVSPPDVISRNATVKNYSFTIEPVLPPTISKDVTDKPLVLKQEIEVKNNDNSIPAFMKWSLLEILDILFSDAKAEFFCFLTYSGLKDGNHELVSYENEMSCLMANCKISGNTTLGDIFRFVGGNRALEHFMSKYSWCDIPSFHEAAKKPSEKKPSDEIKHLQISSYGELVKGQFYIASKFEGIGDMSQLTKDEIARTRPHAIIPETERYSVTMTPMAELVHTPVILNQQFDIRFFKNAKIFSDGFKEFTLLDVLDAIYWDIGYYGDPEKTQVAKEKLIERFNDVPIPPDDSGTPY